MKKIILCTLMTLLIIALADCKKQEENKKGFICALSIFPLYDIARNIAGEEAGVLFVIPAGADPHTFEPLPSIAEKLQNARLFIGVSKGNLLKPPDIKTMAKGAIIFAMANPTPEIMPGEAKRAGAAVVASGRSDFPNQINNVLVYPGIFKGVIESRTSKITEKMKIAAAEALAAVVKKPTAGKIIPDIFDKKVVLAVSNAIKKLAS